MFGVVFGLFQDVESYELRATSYELRATSWELRAGSYELGAGKGQPLSSRGIEAISFLKLELTPVKDKSGWFVC